MEAIYAILWEHEAFFFVVKGSDRVSDGAWGRQTSPSFFKMESLPVLGFEFSSLWHYLCHKMATFPRSAFQALMEGGDPAPFWGPDRF